MTREDIIRMAQEAGLTSVIDAHHKEYGSGAFDLSLYEEVTRFAALVAAAEREACAQIADAEASIEGIAQRIAAAIRARGNT